MYALGHAPTLPIGSASPVYGQAVVPKLINLLTSVQSLCQVIFVWSRPASIAVFWQVVPVTICITFSWVSSISFTCLWLQKSFLNRWSRFTEITIISTIFWQKQYYGFLKGVYVASDQGKIICSQSTTVICTFYFGMSPVPVPFLALFLYPQIYVGYCICDMLWKGYSIIVDTTRLAQIHIDKHRNRRKF